MEVMQICRQPGAGSAVSLEATGASASGAAGLGPTSAGSAGAFVSGSAEGEKTLLLVQRV